MNRAKPNPDLRWTKEYTPAAEAAFSPLAAAKATWASRAHQRAAYIRSLPQRFGEGRPMPPTSEDGDDG